MFLCTAVCIDIRHFADKSLVHTNKVKVLQLFIVATSSWMYNCRYVDI